MSPDDEDRGGPEDGAGERFADLFGPARPVRRKRERILPPSPGRRPRPPAAPSDAEAARERFRRPDPDQPRLGAADGVSDERLARLARGGIEPEERIDLHGLRADGAASVLASRLAAARARGLRCVVVVHGSGRRSPDGRSVLRARLPEWLSNRPCAEHILAFAPAPPRHGGEGATLLLLRRSR